MIKTIRYILAFALPSLVVQSVAQCPDYTGYSQVIFYVTLEVGCGLTTASNLMENLRVVH